MPKSCKDILNKKVYEGTMTEAERDKIVRNLIPVRCKDCKHRDPEDKKCDSGHFIRWQLPRDDDWFCADGERRTEE